MKLPFDAALLVAVLLLCSGLPGRAQDAVIPTDAAVPVGDKLDIEMERKHIAVDRTAHEATFLEAEQACYARFAVSDCLLHLRKARRVALDGLRRQELVLNDMDRKAKALTALERLQRK